MALNDEVISERTVVEQPAVVRREEVREPRSDSAAGWWIGAILAVVLVAGLVFFMTNNTNQADLQAARDAGRSEAVLDTASQQAQAAAVSAAEASRQASQSVAQSTEAAAASARSAADSAAQQTQAAVDNVAPAASDESRDAATSEPAPAQ